MTETQTIPIMEKLAQEEAKEIVDLVLKKLDFAVNPKLIDLRIFPIKFMHVPSLQRFAMAPYKFKRIEYESFIIYTDGEIIIRFNRDSIEIFIKTRYSRKIYHYLFRNSEEVPFVLRPRFGDLVDSHSCYGDVSDETLIKDFIALQLELDKDNVLRQGHLYAVKVLQISNHLQWLMRERDYWERSSHSIFNEIYGHRLVDVYAYAFTDEIYYLETDREVVVEHSEHGVHLLPKGTWILYHPRPVRNKVD